MLLEYHARLNARKLSQPMALRAKGIPRRSRRTALMGLKLSMKTMARSYVSHFPLNSGMYSTRTFEASRTMLITKMAHPNVIIFTIVVTAGRIVNIGKATPRN